MKFKPFAFHADTLTARPTATREHEAQGFYDHNANTAIRGSALKWLIAALLVSIGFAAWTDGSVFAREPNDPLQPSIAGPRDVGGAYDAVSPNSGGLPVTIFIDGPTGFLFVYTAEGWKFVRRMDAGKL
ncbi:MAG: hypothetical protein ABIW48_10955 [Burkholderiales bacterium]|nr:hypothetical protein [Pseudomonadota bacterium]